MVPRLYEGHFEEPREPGVVGVLAWGFALCALVLTLSGCTWTTAKGTKRHLVLGVGLIETGKNVSKDGVKGYRFQSAGVLGGANPVIRGFAIGCARYEGVSVPKEADAIVDLISDPGRFEVRVISITNHNVIQEE